MAGKPYPEDIIHVYFDISFWTFAGLNFVAY